MSKFYRPPDAPLRPRDSNPGLTLAVIYVVAWAAAAVLAWFFTRRGRG